MVELLNSQKRFVMIGIRAANGLEAEVDREADHRHHAAHEVDQADDVDPPHDLDLHLAHRLDESVVDGNDQLPRNLMQAVVTVTTGTVHDQAAAADLDPAPDKTNYTNCPGEG